MSPQERMGRLAELLRLEPLEGIPDLIAGAVHATRGLCAWGSVSVWNRAEREEVEGRVARENLPQPYRPGRLAYAVGPAISAALARLKECRPGALIVHGHGIAHPRFFGLACYLGWMHKIVTVGTAERLLVGEHEFVPPERGQWRPVLVDGTVVGAALRTRDEAKPIYVSPGYGCDVEGAVALVMAATARYRWPEPIRRARMRLKAFHRRRLEMHRRRWNDKR